MTATEWLHVGAEPGTSKETEELAGNLSKDGRKFTKAQILRFGLALGLKQIRKDPSVLVPARGKHS